MANESFANTLLVEVAGSPLPADLATLLTYAYVDDSETGPDLFLLRFRDPQRQVLAKAGFATGKKVALRVRTAEAGAPADLLEGEVTAVALDFDRTGSFTEVRGMDTTHRLFRGTRVVAYPDRPVADIVRAVAERAGLEVGRVDAVPGLGGEAHTQLSQDNVSDWELLSRYADLVGARVTVTGGKLEFTLPRPPAGAPEATAEATRNPLVLEANRNLVALRAELTAAGQVPEVEVRGWDYAHKQELTATAVPEVPGTEVAGADPVATAEALGSPPYRVASPAYRSQAEVAAAATALAGRVGGAHLVVEGLAKGNPALRAGTAVALAGVGEPFAGQYTLTGTRHLFSEDAGYTTAFTTTPRGGARSDPLGGDRWPAPPRGVSALAPAVVSDVRDPAHLGRVKLTLPWLSKEYTTGWARVVQIGAGAGRGALVLPEVGDEVLVGFAGGDLDSAYVLGGLHNGKDAVPELAVPPVDDASGEVAVRGFVSRTGHRLELVESPRTSAVVLRTGDGGLSLRLDQTGKVVELASAGEVKVTGVGVTVDAGAGTLELKGQRVKVTGQSTAELTASGQVTVQGATVRLN